MAWRCCHCNYHNRGPSDEKAPCQNFFRTPRCMHGACWQCVLFMANPPAAQAEYKHLRECKKEERKESGGECVVM